MFNATKNSKWIIFLALLFAVNCLHACDLTSWKVDTPTYRLTFYDKKASNLKEAEKVCDRIGSKLVQLDKVEVRTAVYETLSRAKCVELFWVGARRSCKSCNDWIWLDGTSVDMTYIYWAENQPDNYKNSENRMVIWKTDNKFSDVSENYQYVGVMCQDVRAFVPREIATPIFSLTFYDIVIENWDEAVKTCTWNGATLVQLDDEDVRNAVYNNVPSFGSLDYFWIGAKRTHATSHNWVWVDGTPVDFTVIEWADNQPDNYRNKEDKLIIRVDERKFADVPGNFAYAGTICQKQRGEYCIEYPITCKNGGNCTSTLHSHPYFDCDCTGGYYGQTCTDVYCDFHPDTCKNGGTCTSTPYSHPYFICACPAGYYGQTCADTYCDFHPGTCKNGGICRSTPATIPYYECDCADTGLHGPHCTKRFAAPTILDVETVDCSLTGEITVSWQPDVLTVSNKHRCTATPANGIGSIGDPVEVYPTLGVKQNTKFYNLTIATVYNITVSACPYDTCHPELTSHENKTTGFGLPGTVQNPIVDQIYNSRCEVTWEWPSNVPHHLIEGFQISTTLTYVYEPSNTRDQKNDLQSKLIEPEPIFTVDLDPNRDYSFEVAARTCVGIGPSVAADGKCVSDYDAPNNVALPEDVEQEPSTTRNVKVIMPDETNGPISCMFVIAKLGSLEGSLQKFDIDKLRRLSAQSSGDEMPTATEYLAVAIPRSSVTEKSFAVQLGDQRVSRCDVTEVNSVSRNSKEHFTANNWQLQTGQQYHYYIVTSTPTLSGITMFQQSPANSFQNGSPDSSGAYVWMIGLVIGVMAATVVVVAVMFVAKRKRSSKSFQHQNKSEGTGNQTTDTEIYITSTSHDMAVNSVATTEDTKKDVVSLRNASAFTFENPGLQMNDEDKM